MPCTCWYTLTQPPTHTQIHLIRRIRMSFASLKKSSFQDLLAKADNLNKTEKSGPDERLWKPEVDKAGNGYAVIRFLPAPKGEELPWVRVWNHAFQGPTGQWYIENSLTTLGEKDPVGEVNRRLWNSGDDADKETARKQKRKLSYYSNIYVVKDPKNPENEGKVFLYKYGKKIHDKILAAMKPEFQDETPINVFDLWEGANFKLKIKKVAGYWNYDSSEFDSVSALSADDSELEKIYKSEHSLEAFTSRDQFKSYEDLERRLNLVLGISQRPVTPTPTVDDEEYEVVAPPTPIATTPVKEEAIVEDDDALSYFAKLAGED